jgi:hypothetical protein
LISLEASSLLGVILGFNTTLGSVNPTGVNILSAPFSLNLLGVKKIKIISNAFSTYSFDSFGTGNNNIITTIPITAPPFGLIVFNQFTNPLILRQKTINEIDIHLVDENNEYINFNNINWSILFCLYITYEIPFFSINNTIKDNNKPID